MAKGHTDDTKLRNVEGGKGQPETTERREGGGTESVAASPFLDTGDELDETTVAECHTEDEIWCGDVTSRNVEEGQKESGGAETGDSRVRTRP